jgi:hypothetical protein
MRPDGTYERVRPAEGEAAVDAQAVLLALHTGKRKAVASPSPPNPAGRKKRGAR